MSKWWRGGVIYQIYPRSFQDTNGDGVGDLRGIVQRLPYVASLGVQAIWVSPFFKSPMDDFGYDVEDYCQVDPRFGTLDDFDELLRSARALGLKVVVDMVLNHTSQRHPWFKESRRSRRNVRADWYVWADPQPDGTAPNNWLSMFGGIAWTWEPRREQYYLHNFLPSQPDLNLHNPEVQDALLEQCRFWLERGVDGLRLDACNFLTHDPLLRNNPPRPPGAPPTDGVKPGSPYNRQLHLYDKTQPETVDFLKRLRQLTDRYDDVFLVAEIADDDSLKAMLEYAGLGGPLNSAYSFALLGPELNTELMMHHVETFREARFTGWPTWAFSNHDVTRVLTRWGVQNGDAPPAFAKVLIALLTSLRGTVFLYQGEELGLPEAEVPYEQIVDPYGLNFYPDFRGRDGCRTPMPWAADAPHAGFSTAAGDTWLPIPEEHRLRSVDLQEADPQSVLNFTRRFLRWRLRFPAFVGGDIEFFAAEPQAVAFVRTHGEERLLVAMELGGRQQMLRLPLRQPVEQVLEDHGLPLGQPVAGGIELPPYGAFFAKVGRVEEKEVGSVVSPSGFEPETL